uniref:Putative secreted protein n=1 Tax=Ixodes ricinus TaxID=34613 RepID=A0A6B0UTU7_IXORI
MAWNGPSASGQTVTSHWLMTGLSLAIGQWPSAIGQALADEWPPLSHWPKDHRQPLAHASTFRAAKVITSSQCSSAKRKQVPYRGDRRICGDQSTWLARKRQDKKDTEGNRLLSEQAQQSSALPRRAAWAAPTSFPSTSPHDP